MCWFAICPRTGKRLERVEKPVADRKRTLYLHDGAFDAFFDTGWAFREFLAPHPRPPFEDLVAFVVDGTIPESLMPLVGRIAGAGRRGARDGCASSQTAVRTRGILGSACSALTRRKPPAGNWVRRASAPGRR